MHTIACQLFVETFGRQSCLSFVVVHGFFRMIVIRA